MRKPFDLPLTLGHPSARMAFADLAPGMLAMAAWGCVTGVAMVESGLSPWQAVGMTLIVFAGTAQLASLPLIAMAAPFWLIWLSAVVINLRFVIYALGQRDWMTRLSAGSRFMHGALTTDIVAASVNRRLATPPAGFDPIAYFRMGSLMSWVSWQASSILGIWLAGQLPAGLGLAFLAALAILAMLLPMVRDRAGLACVTAAAVTSLLTKGLPLNLGLLLSIIVGLSAAVMVRQCLGVTPDSAEKRR